MVIAVMSAKRVSVIPTAGRGDLMAVRSITEPRVLPIGI